MSDSDQTDALVRFRTRLGLEGREELFNRRTKQYRERFQIPLDDVWQVAGASFPPANRDRMEYTPTESAQKWIDLMGLNGPWEVHDEPEEITEAVIEEAPLDVEGPLPVAPPLPKQTKKPRKSCVTFDELRRAVNPDKTASELDVVRWVFNNYKVPLEKIDVDGIPSIGAIGYLEHINLSPTNYSNFMANAWVKLLPNKQTLEYEQSLKDDGRQELNMVDDFIRSLGVEDAA